MELGFTPTEAASLAMVVLRGSSVDEAVAGAVARRASLAASAAAAAATISVPQGLIERRDSGAGDTAMDGTAAAGERQVGGEHFLEPLCATIGTVGPRTRSGDAPPLSGHVRHVHPSV